MNTGVGCHSLLQGIFLTQGSNLHLLHWLNQQNAVQMTLAYVDPSIKVGNIQVSHFFKPWVALKKIWPSCWRDHMPHGEKVQSIQISMGNLQIISVLFPSWSRACSVTQLCPTLLQPHGLCSPPGFSVHGISQARILEWVALLWWIFLTRYWTHVSWVSCIDRRIL